MRRRAALFAAGALEELLEEALTEARASLLRTAGPTTHETVDMGYRGWDALASSVPPSVASSCSALARKANCDSGFCCRRPVFSKATRLARSFLHFYTPMWCKIAPSCWCSDCASVFRKNR
jgi:hypothetical protein